MSKRDLVALLNEDLELRSVVQYVRHVATIVVALALLVGLPGTARPGAAEEGAAPRAESPADWIARANEALLPGESMVARVRIVTRDGFGGTTLDVMDMIRSSDDERTRTLIEVEAPEAGEGAAYEILARPGEPLERWAWLPEVRRIRVIEGVRRTDPFLGTEFTYEDLALALPVERGEGSVDRVGEPPDRRVEIESSPYHYYGRVVTRIDPETHLPTTVRFYDRAGQLFREQRFGKVRRVDGRPFPTEIEIRDLLTGTRSTLSFESLHFDVPVSEQRFLDSAVRRRLATHSEVIPDPPDAPPPDV